MLDEIVLDGFEENGEWKIISSTVENSILQFDGYCLPELTVTLTLRRRRMYYVLTICVPILVLSVLNYLVYLLPPASGEKISFCLTILLAYMLYISFLTDNLPRSSQTTSYLVLYLILMICLSCLSVLISVVVVLFWHKSNASFAATAGDGRIDQKENETSDEIATPKANRLSSKRCFVCKKSQVYPPSNDVKENPVRMEKQCEKMEISWRTVEKRLDRISFICVRTLTVIAKIMVMILLMI